MMKFSRYILLIGAVLLGFTACSEDTDCSDSARPYLNCSIYRIDEATQQLVKDTLANLTVTAFGTDSILINNESEVSFIKLPLQYTQENTTFVFHYNQNLRDTLIIQHSNKPYFLSMDCGYQMRQNIKEVTTSFNAINDFKLRYRAANIDETENIQFIY